MVVVSYIVLGRVDECRAEDEYFEWWSESLGNKKEKDDSSIDKSIRSTFQL